MTPLVHMLVVLVVMYLLLLALMVLFQRKLMYLPSRDIGPPEGYGLQGFSEVFVKNAEGLSIQLWYRPAQPGFPTVAYFHGNASHIGNRAQSFSALVGRGFGLMAVSYCGFGKSEGKPSEKNIYSAARAGMEFLLQEKQLPVKRIMLYGESLGSGVAVQMATEYDVGALVLEAAYLSVAKRAAEIYYYVPVRWLIRDRFDSLSKIARVKAPVLLFHGERDGVIPLIHGKTLFAAATAPKKSYYFPTVAHNDFDSAVISAHVLDFAKEHGLLAQ